MEDDSPENRHLRKEIIERGGIYIDTDLEEMLEYVYISPFAEEWFVEVVNGIMKKYGISGKRVQKSYLSEKPLY